MAGELDLEMMRKAILFECGNILEKNKNQAHDKPRIFHQVTNFYDQLRDKFKYEIHLDINLSFGPDAHAAILTECTEWINENGIVAFMMNDSFHFINEEDATAFKLRWK